MVRSIALTFLFTFLLFQAGAQTNLQWHFNNTGSQNGVIYQMLTFPNEDLLVFAYNHNGDLDPGPGANTSGISSVFARYSPTGALVFARPLSYNSTSPNIRSMVEMDKDGNFYLAFGGPGTYDLDPAPGVGELNLTGLGWAFVKFDAMGNYKWGLAFSTNIHLYRFNPSSDNSLIITGTFEWGTADLDPGPGNFIVNCSSWYDGFVAKFDSSGNFITAKVIQSNDPNAFFYLIKLGIDSNDNIYIGGLFEGSYDVDPGPQVFNLYGSTSTNSNEWFFIKLDNNLNFAFGYKYPEDSGFEIIVDKYDYVYLHGLYKGTIDMDPKAGVTNITTPPNHRCFYLARYDQDANLVWVKTMQTTSSITGTMTTMPYVDDQGLLNFDMYLNDSIVNNGFGFPQLPDNGFVSPGIYMTQIDTSGTCSYILRLPDNQNPRTRVKDDTHFYFSGRVYSATDIQIGPGLTISTPTTGNEFFISYYSRDPSSNRIDGKAFLDYNGNNLQDLNESGIQNLIVNFGTGNLFVSTDNNGRFSAYVPVGNYTVNIPSYPGYLTAPVPLVHSANFTNSNQIDSLNNFAFSIDTTEVDLSVYITDTGPARPGMVFNYNITYTNSGATAQSGDVTLIMDSALTVVSTTQVPSMTNWPTMQWGYSNLMPLQSMNVNVLVRVDSAAVMGDTIFSFVNITPLIGDNVPSNNADSSIKVVVTSYDPNSKEVVPATAITEAQVANGIDLLYTIRFQNTGNDTAFKVVILDTLSGLLDISSLRIISMSHPGYFTLYPGNLMEFRFNNILLPDSNVNEPASHGFIKYKIKPKSNLLMGAIIENTSYIYFDLNPGIATNITQTPVVDWLGIQQPGIRSDIVVYPNPFSETLNIKLTSQSEMIEQFELTDISGRMVEKQKVYTRAIQVSGTNFSTGVYLLKIQTGTRIHFTRLVKQ